MSGQGEKVILAVGETTFGIYLTEDMIRNQIVKFIASIHGNDFMIAVLYTLSSFAAGVALIFAMKKIPVLRRLV